MDSPIGDLGDLGDLGEHLDCVFDFVYHYRLGGLCRRTAVTI